MFGILIGAFTFIGLAYIGHAMFKNQSPREVEKTLKKKGHEVKSSSKDLAKSSLEFMAASSIYTIDRLVVGISHLKRRLRL